MLEKRFNHLEKPLISQYEDYLPTAFSSELTLLQKVNKIIQDLNRSFDLTNEMVDYLNRFIETFDEKLYETLEDVLTVWLEDGRLADIMLQINEKIIEFEETYNQKIVDLNSDLSNLSSEINEKISVINRKKVYLRDYYEDTINDYIPIINNILTENKDVILIVDDIYPVIPTVNNFIFVPDNTIIIGVGFNCGFKVTQPKIYNQVISVGSKEKKSSNVMIDSIIIDQNIYDDSTQPHSENRHNAIFLGLFENVIIKNCTFKANGINTIATTTFSKYLYIYNNYFEWKKTIASTYYDNSVIYIECLHYSVENNRFYALDTYANGGIELHWGLGNAINNNINGFQVGVNVQSSYISDNLYGLFYVTDNIIKDCFIGVRLWTYEKNILRNVVVSNNVITANQITRNVDTFFYGIGFAMQSNGGSFSNIVIDSNTIIFEQGVLPVLTNPEMCGGISLKNNQNVDTIQVTNNTILNCPLNALLISAYNKELYSNVYVVNNIVRNFGDQPNINHSYQVGLVLTWTKYHNLIVKNNLFTNNNYELLKHYKIQMESSFTGILDINDNFYDKKLDVYPNQTVLDDFNVPLKLVKIDEKETNLYTVVNKGDFVFVNSEEKYYVCTFSGTCGNLGDLTATTNGNPSLELTLSYPSLNVGDVIQSGGTYARVTSVYGNNVSVTSHFTLNGETITYLKPTLKEVSLL